MRISSIHDMPDVIEVTAKRVVERQQDQQRKRRKTSLGRGTDARSSTWSIVASSVCRDGNNSKFICEICLYVGKLNKNYSTSNVIDHYQAKHESVQKRLVTINESNSTSLVIEQEINTAKILRELKKQLNNFILLSHILDI